MTYKGDITFPTEFLEYIAAQSFDKLPDLVGVFPNKASSLHQASAILMEFN
jgi:hypothetical protein